MRRFAPALVGLTVLTASACSSGGGDPAQDLATALTSLTEDDFAWQLGLDVDNSVLSDAAQEIEGLGSISMFISSLQIGGRVVGGDTELHLGLLGQQVFEMRSIGDEQLFVRLGVQELLASFGADPQALLSDLGAQGIPEEFEAIALTALAGEWIGLEASQDDLARIFGEGTPDGGELAGIQQAFADVFEDPGALLERIGTVTATDGSDGAVVYDVEVDLAAAADFFYDDLAPLLEEAMGDAGTGDLAELRSDLDEALADAPETVSGLEVTVTDGEVTRIVLDLIEFAGAFSSDLPDGDARLVFDLSREDVEAVEAPTTSTFLSADDLAALVAAAQGA